jgi:hypothetical protein
MRTQTNGRNPVRQAYGSYQHPIERRAVVAAGMIKQNGWTQKQASGLLCVNPGYVGLVRRLNDEDLLKLSRRELKLSHLWKNYRRDLAERRAKRLAAERGAQVQAECEAREALVRAQHEAQTRELDSLFDCVGVDRVIDRFVGHYGLGGAFQALDVNLQRHGRDIVEVVLCSVGPERAMRALDKLTQPHAVAAE